MHIYVSITNLKKFQKNPLPNFPIIKIGKKYLVPKDEFEKWVKNSLYKKLLQSKLG